MQIYNIISYMQVKADCIMRKQEALAKLTTGLVFVLLYGRIQVHIIQDL